MERECSEIRAELNEAKEKNEAMHKMMSQWLNRRASVEDVLYSVAAGKRGALTPEECREMAIKLGVPDK